MAQLVFVHGVATRAGAELSKAEALMRQLFQAAVFKDVRFDFEAPHWGDLVPPIAPGIYPTNEADESFSVLPELDPFGGPGIGADDGDGAAATGMDLSISKVAETSPAAALDAIFSAVAARATEEGRELDPDELGAFMNAVERFKSQDGLSTLAGLQDDDALALTLAPDTGSHGVASGIIGAAISHVTGRVRSIASGLAYGLVRDSIRPAVGLFSGDVFAYLHQGSLREQIRQVVAGAIGTALERRRGNEPLIMVGHSMGGVILTDILSDPASAGLPPDLEVDCLFTVGSQPSLFQSVGALGGGAPASGGRMPKRSAISHWLNVFDPIDPLAFAAEPVFEGVKDLKFDSITGVASAHTTYFQRPQFYARFADRASGLGLIR